ncbi:MAG: response regulator [Lachnospiraceae bacterium]|nr:response regulator [Lachnospiraceae bacterium]
MKKRTEHIKKVLLGKWNEKMYVLTIVGTLAALFIMVMHNYITFYSNAAENLEDIGTASLAQVTEQLEGYLSTGMNAVQTTAVTLEYMMENDSSPEKLEEFLTYESAKYTAEIDENFTGIYGLFNGTYIDGIGWVPDENYVPREREWYIIAKEAQGDTVLVPPYLDAQTGTIMMSISKMFPDNDSVISLDIELNEIQNITESIRLNGVGYGFVVDQNGLVVAHNDISQKGKDYNDDDDMGRLLEKVYLGAGDCFEIDLAGETYTVFSDKVMNDWYVVMVVSKEKLFHDVTLTLIRNILICTVISALIVFFYGYTIRKIKRSIKIERESNQKVEQMNMNIVRALVKTIDAKDRYTNGHSLRVAEYALEIAKRMNKSAKEQEQIYYAGLLHDVGKIRIPEEVIDKAANLTDEEFEQIKIHPITGYHILKDIYEDKLVALGAKFHHERFDGRGYPNGLVGKNIPEIARIICVADTYDAMASNRSYRKTLPQEVIRKEIEKGKGTQFDPEIADVMLQMIDEDKEYKMKESDLQQKTILVVDDDPININMVEFIMKDEPLYEMIGVAGGREALELLDKVSVDLILLDVQMPEMDGFETLLRIREKCTVPVAFMTGDKDLKTIQKATEMGVDDYINKPFMPLALKEIIHSIFNN